MNVSVDLIPGVRYRLRSLSNTDLIPPMSGIYRKTLAVSPIVSDKAANTTGFIVSTKYSQFSQHEAIVPMDKLIPGQKYILFSKKDHFPPTKVTMLGFNYTMLFTDVEIGSNMYIPERILESHTTQITQIPTEFRYGFAPYRPPSASPSPWPSPSLNSSSSKNSANSLGKMSFFKAKTRRRQHRTKSSRSRKYI